VVTEKIKEVHEKNYGVYGIRKVHAELARQDGVEGRPVARRTVSPTDESQWTAGDATIEDPAHHPRRQGVATRARTLSSGSSPPRRPTGCG
jgi:putative transposase